MRVLSSEGMALAIWFHSYFGARRQKARILVDLLLYRSPMSITRRLENNMRNPRATYLPVANILMDRTLLSLSVQT